MILLESFSNYFRKTKADDACASERHLLPTLYDANTIDQLPWPQNDDGEYAKKFLTPLVKNGIHTYIENIHADIKVIHLNHLILPILAINDDYNVSHVCSPYAHYITFSLESLHLMGENRFLKGITKLYLKLLGKILRFGKVNKIVYVNNWLFSADLYPAELDEEAVSAITACIKKHYPGHSIAFRSINAVTTQKPYISLPKNGFDLIPSRQIFVTDSKKEGVFQTRIFKSDLKLMKDKNYEVVDNQALSSEEIPRVLELYKKLYLDKYSTLHPQVNLKFMQLAVDQQLLQIKALKKDGRLDGVAGYVSRNGVMYSPFFGYDTSLPQETGLYRILSTVLSLEAQKNQYVFNQSAGASFYKKVRRAEPTIEYLAVYHKHLPYLQQTPWLLLKWIMNSVGVKFMEKY